MRLEMVFATLRWSGWERCVDSWRDHSPSSAKWSERVMFNGITGDTLIQSYQRAFEESDADILGYVHDDLVCMEEYWYYRVMGEFEDPTVGMVGFGGAKGFGSPDLYKKPYELPQLGRSRFMSNLKNAEDHGERFTKECDVAVLDGLAMFVRRDVLKACGGWPVGTEVNYFCYDLWLSAAVRRQGLRTRLVGISCDHLSGKTASMVQLQDSHAAAHDFIYHHFQDILPFEVE